MNTDHLAIYDIVKVYKIKNPLADVYIIQGLHNMCVLDLHNRGQNYFVPFLP